MKAQTLAVCITNYGCNKDCPYCISKMTGFVKPNYDLKIKNLPKVISVAKKFDIFDVILTGKGEPLFKLESISETLKLTEKFSSEGFPVVLQTNGIFINKELQLVADLYRSGINIISISIDDIKTIEKYKNLWEKINSIGIIPRIIVNLTNEACEKELINWASYCRWYRIRQLSFREITAPNTGLNKDEASQNTVNWIKKNIDREKVLEWYTNFKEVLGTDARYIRILPYGAILYDYKGISVTYFNYCIQDGHGENDIRSLIFQEDGHLYTTWNSPASIIF